VSRIQPQREVFFGKRTNKLVNSRNIDPSTAVVEVFLIFVIVISNPTRIMSRFDLGVSLCCRLCDEEHQLLARDPVMRSEGGVSRRPMAV